METPGDKLLLFNSMMLLTKSEVLESFDDFTDHHRQMNNDEGYSESKRKVLLSLCEEFRKELKKTDIPPLSEPWYYYDYSVTNDGLELSLLKCESIEFDEIGEISSMASSKEHVIMEIKCEYLSVEQYAEIYDVATTTVRQWIRRCKLRTAVKKGRDWLIPALADKPKRGFDSVIYQWTLLDISIIDTFPFLAESNYLYLTQDEGDKKKYHAVTGWSESEDHKEIELSSQERERLELLLFTAPGVKVEDINTGIRYVPDKRGFSLPILRYQLDDPVERTFPFRYITVEKGRPVSAFFAPEEEPGDSSTYDYTTTYLIPVNWTFWGVPPGNERIIERALESEDYTDCTLIGAITGHLIMCRQMIEDGYNPLEICDAESADLEYLMSSLTADDGPLNEWGGEPQLDVLYINELTIEKALQGQGLGSRILQELPALCLEMLHIMPGIVAYYPAPLTQDRRDDSETLETLSKLRDMVIGFYSKNGLQELCDSDFLYAFTEL